MKANIFTPLLLGLLLPTAAMGQGTMSATDAGPWQDVLDDLMPRCIGPTTMGGRIADISVYEREPRIFYVATASGGLYKTENGGITMTRYFDHQPTASLGAVAVSQKDPNLVWVGTGESSSRNSVAWGDGVYKSTDGGGSWQKMGLEDSRHIGKILIDPDDNNTVLVGALGRLWGPNEDRGVYKTTDGGKTWRKTLYVDDKTGCIDMVMDPSNPKVVFAAMWQRLRKAYDFTSGGPGSGLYKSTDGGETWKKVTKGLPDGPLGRIGLTIWPRDPKVMMALVEARRPKPGESEALSGGTYKSTDGGETWTMMGRTDPRPFYFSKIAMDPQDQNRVYIGATNIHVSDDAGKTFRVLPSSVHVDHHALWVDPNDGNHLLIGEDGGLGQSRDKGKTWEMINNIPIGQFYAVAADMRKPYWVYGGLQDNGSWAIPTQTSRGGVAYYDAYGIGGGDGFHVQVDPNDWTTVYSESQGGFISRVNQLTGEDKFIQPRKQGVQYRFNWSTPFILSPHNSHTLYVGSQKLLKSVDRGDNWKEISPDLTTNDPAKQKPGKNSVTPENTGAEMHCTIITISESPLKQGLLWVGTDDGLVHVSMDDGGSWTEVTKNIPDLPANTWCSRVIASKWSEGRAYATFDGHRNNDFKPYVYVTEDYGKTWKKLNSGLPDFDCVYVIREGVQNPNLLYLGSEESLRISLDRGEHWSRFRANNWPTVAVHDLLVHPRDLDLVVGTHGMGIWTIDVNGLEQLTDDAMKQDVELFKPENVLLIGRSDAPFWEGDRNYMSPNTQPGTRIFYWLKSEVKGDVKVRITGTSDTRSMEIKASGDKGMNAVAWNGRLQNALVGPGQYNVVLVVNGKEYKTTVTVEKVYNDNPQPSSPIRAGK